MRAPRRERSLIDTRQALDSFAATAAVRRRVTAAAAALVVAAVGVFGVALIIGFLVVGRRGGGPIQGVDDAIARWYLHHRGGLIGISKFVASYADGLPLALFCVALSALLLCTVRSTRAFVPLLGYLGAEFEVNAVRAVIHRPRPESALYPAPGAIAGIHETGYSFPSGHAVTTTAVLFALLGSVALARNRWWPWAAALLVSLVVADTRLVLGVHWFSDVAFGLLFGIVWGTTVAWATRQVEWADVAAVARRRAPIGARGGRSPRSPTTR
jgi:undecaprenyl-diphosphatase